VNITTIFRIFAANGGNIYRKHKLIEWQSTFTNTKTGQILHGKKQPSMLFWESKKFAGKNNRTDEHAWLCNKIRSHTYHTYY
jgi:hypothetical protein